MSANIKVKFEAHKLAAGDPGVNEEGLMPRRVAKSKVKMNNGKVVKNKDGDPVLLGGFEYEDIMVDPGWMVYFPSGSSIHVWTKEEMERQGFLKDADLVDMDTGYAVAPMGDTSLRARSERIASRTRSSRSAQI